MKVIDFPKKPAEETDEETVAKFFVRLAKMMADGEYKPTGVIVVLIEGNEQEQQVVPLASNVNPLEALGFLEIAKASVMDSVAS